MRRTAGLSLVEIMSAAVLAHSVRAFSGRHGDGKTAIARRGWRAAPVKQMKRRHQLGRKPTRRPVERTSLDRPRADSLDIVFLDLSIII
jgi:hypothetical protein